MKYLAFLFLLTPFYGLAENSCEANSELTTSFIEKTLEEVRELSEDEFETHISKFKPCQPATYFVLRGLRYYKMPTSTDNIEKFYKNMEKAVELDSVNAKFIYALILVQDKKLGNVEDGVIMMEDVAKQGSLSGVLALNELVDDGLYTDIFLVMKLLKKVADKRNEKAVIIYAQRLHELASHSKRVEFAIEAVKYIEENSFINLNAEAEFILARIYGDEELSTYSPGKRNLHLKKSAELGMPRAKLLWSRYQELLKNPDM